MANPSALSDRQALGQRALQYYLGHPKPALRATQRINDNLPLPLARIIIDKGASFLFGRDVQAQIVDSEAEGVQTWLDECWRRNRRGILLLKLATNGGIFGHAFVRILDVTPYPRVVVLDPQTVSVATNPDDIDDVWQYTITQPEQAFDNDGDGQDDERVIKRTVVERQGGAVVGFDEPTDARWVIFDQEYRGGADDPTAQWVTVQTQEWGYDWSPVLGCQNIPKPNDYWGESDLPEDVIAILDGINRVASHYSKIIRVHAHPKIWTRGMGTQKLDLSVDAITHLPSDTAELKALEMQSDLASTMALLEKLLDLLSWAVRIPTVAMGQPDGQGSPSGVAIQLRFQPLIEKTEAKRMSYGDMLTEVDGRLLEMGGFGEGMVTQLVWPEVLPKDPIQERDALVLDDQLGLVSKRTMAEALGYDYDQEQHRREEEEPTPVDALPLPLLSGQQPNVLVPQDAHPAVQQGQQALGAALGSVTANAPAKR